MSKPEPKDNLLPTLLAELDTEFKLCVEHLASIERILETIAETVPYLVPDIHSASASEKLKIANGLLTFRNKIICPPTNPNPN